jgi:RNA-directed DNA polymerase
MESVVRFLEEKLSLRVNRDSERCRSGWGTQIARPPAPLERQAWIAPKSINRAKEKIRQITRRKRGVSLA